MEYALVHNRLVIIVDAFDQASGEGRKALLQFLKKLRERKEKGQPCRARLIVTGRPHAVREALDIEVLDDGWRLGKVMPFDAERQQSRSSGRPAPPERACAGAPPN